MNLDKFLGCIYGVAIGDALGMPFETMTAQNIRDKVGEVKGFMSPSLNSHISGSFVNLPVGSWTDDTQLTLATVNAFIKSDGRFDMRKISSAHVRAYKGERRGWGGSTERACQRLSGGKHWTKSGDTKGFGNGVMMKIAPLGLRQTMATEDISPFINKCVEYARMTHLGTPAIVAGAIHAAVINTLACRTQSIYNLPTFFDFFQHLALELEAQLPPCEDKISSQIAAVTKFLHMLRGGYEEVRQPEYLLNLFNGGTSYAYNSFGLSYAIFTKSIVNPDNPTPFNAVLETVNAGGDTDSNASIVGSLIGALHGMKVIPAGLVAGVEGSKMIRERTEKFFEACKSRKK